MAATRNGGCDDVIKVRKLKDASHQIPPEAPEECVSAVRDLIARTSKASGAAALVR